MRVLCTLLGVCIIPFGFLTVWTLTRSLSAASMSSMLLICDGGFATLNRYILLDPLLIFFMTGSVLAHVKFRQGSSLCKEIKLLWTEKSFVELNIFQL